MSKTSVSTLITSIKRKFDYNITDSDLDALIVDEINDAIQSMKQLFLDYGILQEISAQAYFKTVENQAYVDIQNARIVGDSASFTGVAGDKIDVWIDGTEYDDIDVSACTTIALVVTAINTSVGSTVASESDDGYLVITSPTSGSTSSVTIEDDSASSGAVDSLFSVSAERTQSAISDLDEIIMLSERTNDTPIGIISYSDFVKYYPDPTSDYINTPDCAARFNDRIYFGPTPNDNIYIYLDYVKQLSVTSASTMPFSAKYDPLVNAMAIEGLTFWEDKTNAVGLAKAKGIVDGLKKDLIINASKNIGMNRQTESRKFDRPYFSPRKVT